MSILNLTDNSFLSRSRMNDKSVEEIIRGVASMIDEGASIVDVGACSSAPGNEFIPEALEWSRYERVMPALFATFPEQDFSFDCFRVSVLEKLLDCAARNSFKGEFIINDIFACKLDKTMLEFAASNKLQYIAMDSTADPYGFFRTFEKTASRYRLNNWIADPGFGFGKTLEQNWAVFEDLPRLHDFGKPVLAALSHKRMIYVPLGLTPLTCTEQSVAAEARSVELGADIVRTHDVALLSKKLIEQ